MSDNCETCADYRAMIDDLARQIEDIERIIARWHTPAEAEAWIDGAMKMLWLVKEQG